MLRPHSIPTSSIFLFFDVTDKGPDQSCRKRLTSERIAASGCTNIIYVPGWCFLHMFNACVKDGLCLVDDLLNTLFSKELLSGFTKYFDSIGKVVNTWREKASEVMEVWDRIHHDADKDTQRLGRRYPLAVIGGRWGSVEAAEDYLLMRGKSAVVAVILEVLSGHMKAHSQDQQGRSSAMAFVLPFDGFTEFHSHDLTD